MSNATGAWRLRVAANLNFVVAEPEVAEYLEAVALQHLPQAPQHCNAMMLWQGQIIPVVNCSSPVDTTVVSSNAVVVLAYQEKPKEPLQYIAMQVDSSPEKVIINDDDACGWPELFPALWAPLVLAFVQQGDTELAIIDISRLASEEFNQFANSQMLVA